MKPLGHYLCAPEPGRLGCVISIEKGVNGDAYPVAVIQKVRKNLPVSFYSPTPGFNVSHKFARSQMGENKVLINNFSYKDYRTQEGKQENKDLKMFLLYVG